MGEAMGADVSYFRRACEECQIVVLKKSRLSGVDGFCPLELTLFRTTVRDEAGLHKH